MFSSLASFTGQFSPTLIQQGRALFEAGNTGALTIDKGTYKVVVVDGNRERKVSVRLEAPKVTDLFCTCGPDTCSHVIAVFFSLRKELDVEEEAYIPEPPRIEEKKIVERVQLVSKPTRAKVEWFPVKNRKGPQQEKQTGPRYSELGNRVSYFVHQPDTPNDGGVELQEMAARISLKEILSQKLEQKAMSGLEGDSYDVEYVGAVKLLGAAVREYEAGNYEAVFAVAKAVVKAIMDFGQMGGHAVDCCKAAFVLFDELYHGERTTAAFKARVFNWLTKAWHSRDYEEFDDEMMGIIGKVSDNGDHQVALLKMIEAKANVIDGEPLSGAELEVALNLYEKGGDMLAVEVWKQRFPHHFRQRMIDDALESKNYAYAKKLATEGLDTRDKEHFRKVLYDIALLENDLPGIRDYHVYLFLKNGDMEEYEMIRISCNEEEWKSILPEIINGLEQQGYYKKKELRKVLAREGLQEELLNHIRTSYIELDELIELAPALIEKNGDQILEILRKELKEQAHKSKQRELAKRYAASLKKVCALNGGRKMVREMLKELFTEYPGWNVIKSEVAKYM